ncbi:MAG: radical SAM protein [Candidatus Sulfobium sp.]|jgi:7-carboxy-7-deazaguanine synthase
MKVCELFTSIQGESTYSGLPCVFVRLTGCNLRCSYCDTQYSYDGGDEMEVADIVERIKEAGVNLVEVTGGEPLLQGDETLRLIGILLEEGYRVLVETNGSKSVRDIDSRAVVILDVKTPGSGMNAEMDFSNFEHIRPSDEVKFVICDRADYDWSKKLITDHSLEGKCTILFSAAIGRLAPRQLADWVLQDGLDVRLNVQIQKYIFGPGERGV